MSQMVRRAEILSVESLFAEYQRFARSYELADNPLAALTRLIPASATHYVIVPEEDRAQRGYATAIMKKLAGRRKVREIIVDKHAIRYRAFAPTSLMVIMYA